MSDEHDRDRHEFSAGAGFDDPYEGFDLDPPELAVDPDEVDPVDDHVLADLLDEGQLPTDDVDVDTLLDVGLDYMGINRHEQAVDAFERAARFAETDALEQESWINKAVAHAELEEWAAAIDANRAALNADEEGPFVAEAHTNLSYALWEHGETTEAYHHAERAVREDDRMGQAWYNLGFMENEQARHEEAVDCLENAVRLGFQQADVFEEQARAYDELGEEEAAAEAAERAAEIRERREDELVG